MCVQQNKSFSITRYIHYLLYSDIPVLDEIHVNIVQLKWEMHVYIVRKLKYWTRY